MARKPQEVLAELEQCRRLDAARECGAGDVRPMVRATVSTRRYFRACSAMFTDGVESG